MKIKKQLRPIILVGAAGSGKSHLADVFEAHGYKANLSLTTRPMRDGESHMRDYNFVSRLKFFWLLLTFRLFEFKRFNGWWYGTLKSEWRNKNVFIFTPAGIASLSKSDRNQAVICYLDIPEEARFYRLNERSDSDKVYRRMDADRRDFEKYQFDYVVRVTDPFFDTKEIMIELLRTAGEDRYILRALK